MSKTPVVTVITILVIAIGIYIGIRPRATDEAAAGEPAAAHRNVVEPSQADSTTTIASTNNDPRPGDPISDRPIVRSQGIAQLTQHDCNTIARQLNQRPRKRLGFRTSEECYALTLIVALQS